MQKRRFEREKREKANRYENVNVKIEVSQLLLVLIILVGLLASEASLNLENLCSKATNNYLLKNALYMFFFFSVLKMLIFPLSFYQNYIIEHHFSLSNQNLASYLKDEIKEYAIFLGLAILFFEVVYLLIKNYSKLWWLFSSILWITIVILLSKIAPKILIPIFYKLRPIEDEELSQYLFELCRKARVNIQKILKIGFEEKTQKANAAIAGIGNTRCILISDTLLKRFSRQEIGVVVAHEIGHNKYSHMFKLIFLQSLISVIGFYATHQVLINSYIFSIQNPYSISSLPLFLLVFGGINFILKPLYALISRRFEKQADEFAIKLTNDPYSFMNAMVLLGDLNLVKLRHTSWTKVFGDHPDLACRLKMASCMAKKDLLETNRP
jgi:STE24 endopeptidase